ncbi:hypothetical protein F5Y12DRAFT_719671 [Xylaria sp. FL1777]|nr:hypothetical protein F5Y12DRAFT_719671 [Xylaria sp. FL1777]
MIQFEYTLRNPDRVLTIAFGEATPEQIVGCRRLEAAEFGKPLTQEDYVEGDHYLAQKPLVRDGGWRVWCLSLAHDPTEVLTTCKTIPRELFVRDVSGTTRQKAYCIATVATDPRYRGQGLASRLLEYVGAWLDGPGNAVASVLHTSIGDFYDRRGWKKLPAYLSLLSWPADSLPLVNRPRLPETRPVSSAEIPELCKRDVRDVENYLEKLTPGPNESHVSVLPTANLITWLHDRSDFMGAKIRGAPPPSHGTICEGADSWLYWVHDFRKDQLAVQRVRVPAETSQIHCDAVVAMLLDAIEEACTWKLPRVIIWDPSPELLSAMQVLQEKFNIRSETTARQIMSVPSFRWRHADEENKTIIHFNEFYTWS